MTLDEIAGSIRNNIGNGLKEVTNYDYSLEQIKKEISLVRASIVLKESKNGILNPEHFIQRFDNLDLTLTNFPYTAITNSPEKVWYTQIPRLAMTVDNSSLTFVGPTDFSQDFKKYYDRAYKSHRYNRITSMYPFVYVDLSHDYNNHTDLYFFNLDGSGLKKVSVRGIAADPVAVLEADGIFGEDEEFPAPQAVQDVIIETITRKYILYYRQLNHPTQPNTQTDMN